MRKLCVALLALIACSSEQTANSSGGGAGSGGAGGVATGGASGASVGGSAGDAGSQASGGSSAAGGSSATGGSSAAGGSGATGASGEIGPASFDAADLDPASHGGTITFQSIGAPGWYPSRRDPALGPCDAYSNGECCMARHELTTDQLTPWDEELILTLRGPVLVKQIVVYEPESATPDFWHVVSAWDERTAQSPQGMAFDGNGTESSGFSGVVGSECLVDVSSDAPYACGAGSEPYCVAPSSGQRHYGWAGSKLLVLLASMPHAGSNRFDAAAHCSQGTTGGWYDAPWIGLSHGELVRSGKFGSCHCYAKDPAQWYLADGCGQFNVFEVVNDNNQYRNLDLFSTNFFGYAGYVGEGPCGSSCDVSALADVDLIDKSDSTEAASGAIATPSGGPGAAFRRPSTGYRYFLVLLDVGTRSVQLAVVHPGSVPAAVAALLPNLPLRIDRAAVDAVLDLRLPQ